MKRLVIIGDSIMKGVVREADRYRISRELSYAELRDGGIAVDNLSKMGATIEKGLRAIMRRKITEEDDNLVVFSFGGNDCDFDWQSVSDDPTGCHNPKLSSSIFAECYSRCIAIAKEKGAKVAVANLVPLDAHRYMDTISAGRDREKILSWLGDESMLYRWHESYDRVVEQVAADGGCDIIDLRTAFLLSHNYEDLIGPDGIHPSELGYAIVRSCVESTAEQLLG